MKGKSIIHGTDQIDEHSFRFSDLFDLDDIQRMQDLFSDATGVASIITYPDGTPITKPSNFCRLCNSIIRKTKKGQANCFKSDAVLGRQNPDGPIVQPCLSGGLWDAGASITVGGKHIANWLIGQVRNEELDQQRMIQYANEIGADRTEFMKALAEVPVMSVEQFRKVSDMLFAFANQLSEKAYNNLQLKKQIAERETANRMLQESEGNLADIFQTVTEGIAHTTLNGTVLSINNSLERILGKTKETIVGKNILVLVKELLSVKNVKTVLPILKNLLKGKEIQPFEVEYQDKILEVNASINKSTSRLTGVIRDVTGRRMAEKALKNSEERFQLLFNKAPLGYQSLDENGCFLDVNQQWLNILGYTRQEVIGKWFGDFLSPAYVEGFRKRFPLFKSTGQIHSEFEMVHKNGNLLFIAFDGKIGYDPKGNFVQTHCILQDITQSRQAEVALRESEEKFRHLIENSHDVIYTLSAQGIFLFVSPSWTDLLGHSTDQVVGKAFSDFVHPDDILACVEALQRVIKTGQRHGGVEYRAKHLDGSWRWHTSSAVPLWDDRGNVYGFEGTARDITERRLAETALQNSEEKFRTVFFTSPDAIVITRVQDSKFVLVNKGFVDLSGYTEKNTIGKTTLEINIWCDLDDRQKFIDLLNSTGKVEGFETKFRGKNGEAKDVLMSATIIEIQGEKHILTITRDITERKLAEYELIKAKERAEESEARFKALHNASFGGIAIHDHGMIIDCNLGLSELTGYSLDELIGMDGLLLIAPESLDLVLKNINSGYEIPYEAIGVKKNGIKYPIRLEGRQIPYKGKIVRVVEFRDITERKDFERALIKAKEKAEESDRLKSAFLANMSHEIRTPMNGILGFAELLKQPDLTGEKQQKYISVIENSGARMLNIINDLIDISKIESGQMEVSLSDTNINEQIEYVYTFFKPEVEAKGMKIHLKHTLSAKEAIIKTDSEKLYAILTNLVKNAIKYSNDGSIELGYIKKDSFIEFYVKDTGIGIAKERHEAIFDRFVQEHTALSAKYEGAGLGLAISKAYVEMLGGKIWVEDNPDVGLVGKGSVFYFTIPYNVEFRKEIPDTDEGSKEVSIDNEGILEFLIVEDDDTSKMLLTEMVSPFSKGTLYAASGIEAVEICRNNPGIDLVLMDIKMPGMDGYEATRQIRLFNKEVAIIAQTAFGLAGDREKALAAGCNEYLSKPIKKNELVALLKNILIAK